LPSESKLGCFVDFDLGDSFVQTQIPLESAYLRKISNSQVGILLEQLKLVAILLFTRKGESHRSCCVNLQGRTYISLVVRLQLPTSLLLLLRGCQIETLYNMESFMALHKRRPLSSEQLFAMKVSVNSWMALPNWDSSTLKVIHCWSRRRRLSQQHLKSSWSRRWINCCRHRGQRTTRLQLTSWSQLAPVLILLPLEDSGIASGPRLVVTLIVLSGMLTKCLRSICQSNIFTPSSNIVYY
jgi:hypothetical protein